LEDRFNYRHLITTNPNDRVTPALLLQLDYVGAGGDELLIHPDSFPDLADLLEETAQEFDLIVVSESDSPEFSSDVVSRTIPWLSIRWSDSEISPLEDSFDHIRLEKIQPLGETLSLVLTKVVRETDY
jgi:hypothetical protein